MFFKKWNADKNYDHLDTAGKVLHTDGHIPSGTDVRFAASRTPGQVVIGNSERTLVQYPAPGGGMNQDWFNNDQLEVPE